jgi:hypothetical protein
MAELLCSKQALAEVRCLQEQHHVTEGSRCCVFSLHVRQQASTIMNNSSSRCSSCLLLACAAELLPDSSLLRGTQSTLY